MSLALLAAVGLCQAIDRSGESSLRAVFAHYGKMPKFEASISKSARDRKSDAMAPTLTFMLAYDSPKVFRVEFAEYWGGGSTFIQDGKTMKVVSTDGSPTRLRQSGISVMTSNPSLGPGGNAFAVLFLLLEGPSAFDKLVAPDSPIRVRGNTIVFKTKDLGNMSFRLDGKLVKEIEFDNKAGRAAQYRFMPMFSEPPEDPLEIEAITYAFPSRFARGTFDTSAGKDGFVIDERPKPGGS